MLDSMKPLDNVQKLIRMCYEKKEKIPIYKKALLAVFQHCFESENDTAFFVSLLSTINEFFTPREQLFISVYAITKAIEFENLCEHHLIRLCHYGAKAVNQILLKCAQKLTKAEETCLFKCYFSRVYLPFIAAYSYIITDNKNEDELSVDYFEIEQSIVSISQIYCANQASACIQYIRSIPQCHVEAILNVLPKIKNSFNEHHYKLINSIIRLIVNKINQQDSHDDTIMLEDNKLGENIPMSDSMSEIKIEDRYMENNICFEDNDVTKLPQINESSIHEEESKETDTTTVYSINISLYLLKELKVQPKEVERLQLFNSFYTTIKLMLPQLKYKCKIKKLIPGASCFTHFIPQSHPYNVLILTQKGIDMSDFISAFKTEIVKYFETNKLPKNIFVFNNYKKTIMTIRIQDIKINVHFNAVHLLFTRNLIRKYLFSNGIIKKLTYYLLSFATKAKIVYDGGFTYQAFLLLLIHILQNHSPPILPTIDLSPNANGPFDEYFALAAISKNGEKSWAKITKNKKPFIYQSDLLQNKQNVGRIAIYFFEVMNKMHVMRFQTINITGRSYINISNKGSIFIANPYTEENELDHYDTIILSPIKAKKEKKEKEEDKEKDKEKEKEKEKDKKENNGMNDEDENPIHVIERCKPAFTMRFAGIQLALKKAYERLLEHKYDELITLSTHSSQASSTS